MKDLKIFKNKKIIITGHTGFKGSWLAFWLKSLGAKVVGISNNISNPSNFNALGLKKEIKNNLIDIRNLNKLKKIISVTKPDYIFHLAAQSLVKKSYMRPINTFNTNSIGTLNVLESIRNIKKKCTVIIITSDKSYRNLELKRGYKENDILGGIDPYSASKASAEIIIQSYFHSYLKKNKNLRIGVARAGNVIGGGDWSEDRLVPDCIKSWSKNKKVILRNPDSTRPWQHVLEAVGAYLLFAKKLSKDSKLNGEVFNFGSKYQKNFTVLTMIKKMKNYWHKVNWKIKRKNKNEIYYESKLLRLNCIKAKKRLKWNSILNINETIGMTINWYKKFYSEPKKIRDLALSQIKTYEKLILKRL
jgi:CDP-glucose 4,6-dehydratase|tara:strand:+ start:662 stop:1741 length:1080 start_codon:yes stop_codon:yes gene_type:complete